ncbi:hypothetical protein [Roseibium sp.]|uniref:hypothetical protein n=1 Tax=Roseibium sp. TaxID=1936156 RepID=UPI001B1E8C5C|nr:hypothetical protein [Roseibium sp.]MBO6860770.1 hypothetical protein [Roseibium sp.]
MSFVQNTWSSLKVLKTGLEWFHTATDETPEYRVWMVGTLVDSLQKCISRLEAEIRFYHSAKSPTRALAITEPDGSQRYMHGAQVETLCLRLPSSAEDAVVYGKPAALKAIADALAATGQSVYGPAPIRELAQQLVDACDPPGNGDPNEHRSS